MKKMSRNKFIKDFANWLPEHRHLSLSILDNENADNVTLWLESKNVCVVKNLKGETLIRIQR